MEMDINQKLDSILLENEIISKNSCDDAIKVIQELEKDYISDSKRVALYGVGIEAEGLLHFISKFTTYFKIDVCFDRTMRKYQYKKIIQNAIVYPIECIVDMKVDCVILGSYAYKQTFIKNLETLGYCGRVVNLYDFLEGYIKDHYANYEMVYHTRKAYLKAEGIDKFRLLQQLIKEYILLKDFEKSFYYIDIYISEKFSDYERYIKLKKDIEVLLKEIRSCIKERQKKDIIINWIDALSYYDIPEFPFLYKKLNEGVCFENAYTVMPWTTETTKTILCGEYPIEGKLFLREHLSQDNVKLLKILYEYGYGFAYCGMPKFAKLFDESVITPIGYYDNKYSGSLQKQWDALGILCQTEMPMCILIHTLRETHEPFICGEVDTFIYFGSTEADWRQEMCRKQAEISGKYINDKLEFYEDFYKENAVQIYMSDHGRVGNSPLDEKKIHIMFSVSGKGIQKDSIQSLFSLVKFPDLIKKILEDENDWISLTEDYVLIENLDAYDERVVEDTLSGRLSKDEMYQCRGIVTSTDRYFIYAYGKEYYFNDRYSKNNEIADPASRERISQLKELCGDEFIDIFKYEKFKYSRQLYANADEDLHDDEKGINV